MMTLDERIAWTKDMGWDYEVFETKDDQLCLQAWDDMARAMHEWAYTKNGEQVEEECIYTY